MLSWRFVVVGLSMVLASGLAYALRPVPAVDVRAVDLERQIPLQFAQWREVRTNLVQMDLAPRDESGATMAASLSWPYDQTLARTYTRPDGEVVMLALAWGSKQRQEIKVHRPELCYLGQGFQILKASQNPLQFGDTKTVATTRLVTRSQARTELVTYWIRIGDEITPSAWRSRLRILEDGLGGQIPDGILVRVSQVKALPDSPEASYKIQDEFLRDLVSAVDIPGRRLLLGSAKS